MSTNEVHNYEIDGYPLSKRSRQRLMVMVKAGHEELLLARETIAQYEESRTVLESENSTLRMNAIERDGDMETLTADRDHYKKESVDNWLRLTTAESDLSKAQGAVAALKRDVEGLSEGSKWLRVAIAVLAAVIGVFVWLA